MALRSPVKEWKLVQGVLVCGLIVVGAGAYLLGRFDPRDFLTINPPPPQTPLLLYGQMRDAYSKQDWVRALDVAQKLRRARPGDEEAERVWTACLLRLGRFAEARDALKAFVTGHPDDVPALLSLAVARGALGEEEIARQTLHAVLAHPRATPSERVEARDRLYAAEFLQRERDAAPKPLSDTPPPPPGDPPWMRAPIEIDRKALGLPPATPARSSH